MYRLELQDITKQYPTVRANDRVDLRVRPGEIHAVLGENGAGKSTLMKIIYGAVRPDAGRLLWDGVPVEIHNPHAARALGIAMVFQHFSLFESLTAAENVWLGLDPAGSLAEVARRMTDVADRHGLPVDPGRPVHTLSVGERQRVEIVRALLASPRLLILDEPTSVLTPQAVVALFETLRGLAAAGCSILYISHKLDEIRALCHRCTVLRAGRVVAEVDPSQETEAGLSRLMIGAEPPPLDTGRSRPGDVALEVAHLDLPRRDRFGVDLHDIVLRLHAGEILGVAGVSGHGQGELLAALSGEDPRAAPASIRLFDQPVGGAPPRALRRAGLRCVPEERLGRATVPQMPLWQNTLLTREEPLRGGHWIRKGDAASLAATLIRGFRVQAAGPRASARSLSGGNLQKFIMGREIQARPRVLVVSQPTWGVDIGATAQIRNELLALRAAGGAVLVFSEDLDELFEICDALVVMARGRLSPAVPTAQASREQVGTWMSGLWPRAGTEAAATPARSGEDADARA